MRRRHALIATFGATAPPFAAAVLFASGLFGSDPDDNSWTHAVPGLIVLAIPATCLLWLLYRRLGQVQASSPELGRVASFATTFAGLPWLLLVAASLYNAPYTQAPLVLFVLPPLFLAIWLCLFFGGWLQWRMLRPNSAFKPTLLRSADPDGR